MDFRIIHHHVGARGNVPLPLDPRSPIRNDFAVYYYDADESAITDTLRGLVQVGEANLLPYCLGEKSEKRAFHISNDAYASSLYPFNRKYQNFTKATYLGQSRMGDSHATVRRIDVDVVALDEICSPVGDIPMPDYLSIDVEGAELDIMRGAARSLGESVVWLRSEMWIHPIYEGAATMETTLGYLKDQGFDLFHMAPYGEYEADVLTFGMHGLGQTLGAEVDLHKSVADLVGNGGAASDETILRLYKLAFLAFMQGGNGLGYLALKHAAEFGGTYFVSGDGTKPAAYLEFLADAWKVFENMARNLPIFPDLSRFVHEKRAREHESRRTTDPEKLRALGETDREARAVIESKYRPHLDRAHKLAWMDITPLERTFQIHGLVKQANEIKKNRKKHCESFVSLFYSLGDGPLR